MPILSALTNIEGKDDHPDKEKRGAILGWEYPEASPLGFNGAFYYFKLGMDF